MYNNLVILLYLKLNKNNNNFSPSSPSWVYKLFTNFYIVYILSFSQNKFLILIISKDYKNKSIKIYQSSSELSSYSYLLAVRHYLIYFKLTNFYSIGTYID